MWIADSKSYGLVVQPTDQPRYYLVQTSRGRLRRIRHHNWCYYMEQFQILPWYYQNCLMDLSRKAPDLHQIISLQQEVGEVASKHPFTLDSYLDKVTLNFYVCIIPLLRGNVV